MFTVECWEYNGSNYKKIENTWNEDYYLIVLKCFYIFYLPNFAVVRRFDKRSFSIAMHKIFNVCEGTIFRDCYKEAIKYLMRPIYNWMKKENIKYVVTSFIFER